MLARMESNESGKPQQNCSRQSEDFGQSIAELAVVVPTLNEADNIEPLLAKIETALQGVRWEIIFVDDDSQDRTRDTILERCRVDPRVRLIHRVGRRGLSSAVVEGILSTSTPYVAVIDADMQHDERLLKPMLDAVRNGEADLAVGTRYAGEGGVGDWGEHRQIISRIATLLSRLVVKVNVSDPMSGFFVIQRNAFDAAVRRLSVQGYKVLLDIITSAPKPLHIREFPYTFRSRQHGESKLDPLVSLEYIQLILDKMVGRWLPVRFMLFMVVGGLGVIVHLAVLTTLFVMAGAQFVVAQSVATLSAMTFNFCLNNVFTYRDKRLRGFWPLLRGLLTFYLVCSAGLVSNVGVASFMFQREFSWWLSGIAGILVGAVWNYSASSVLTWRRT
jgi:dolichol-phosphate mannosyltransferase